MRRFTSLKVIREDKIDFVEIDYSPMNVLDEVLASDLWNYVESAQQDDDLMVIVFKSANPDFFISYHHPRYFLKQKSPESQTMLDNMHKVITTLLTWDKVTIGQIRGRSTGGGSEFIMALDMRFAAMGKTFIRHAEVSLGFIPCKGGTQLLPNLVGKGCALEMILNGKFLNSDQLERYRYINAALAEPILNNHVRKLALRIASFSKDAVRGAKKLVNQNTAFDLEAFRREQEVFNTLVETPEAHRRFRLFIDFVENYGDLTIDEPNWNEE